MQVITQSDQINYATTAILDMSTHIPIPLARRSLLTLLFINFIYQYDLFIFFYKIFKFFIRYLLRSTEMSRIVKDALENDLVPSGAETVEFKMTRVPQEQKSGEIIQAQVDGMNAFLRVEPAKRKHFLYRLGMFGLMCT